MIELTTSLFSHMYSSDSASGIALNRPNPPLTPVQQIDVRSTVTMFATTSTRRTTAAAGAALLPTISSSPILSFSRQFRTLDLTRPTLQALEESFGFKTPLPVQAKVIPKLLDPEAANHDAIVRARTGTGKTLCYGVVAVETLAELEARSNVPPGVKTLIIAPSRELALQIAKEIETLLTFHPDRNVLALVGGMSRKQDCTLIRRKKPSFVVATPGRLLDHFEQTFHFQNLFENLQVLVLDEVDRLCELGFLENVKQILSYLPEQKRSLLFSATIPDSIEGALVGRYLKANTMFLDCVTNDSGGGAASTRRGEQFGVADEIGTVSFAEGEQDGGWGEEADVDEDVVDEAVSRGYVEMDCSSPATTPGTSAGRRSPLPEKAGKIKRLSSEHGGDSTSSQTTRKNPHHDAHFHPVFQTPPTIAESSQLVAAHML